jgi:hypothetical protein
MLLYFYKAVVVYRDCQLRLVACLKASYTTLLLYNTHSLSLYAHTCYSTCIRHATLLVYDMLLLVYVCSLSLSLYTHTHMLLYLYTTCYSLYMSALSLSLSLHTHTCYSTCIRHATPCICLSWHSCQAHSSSVGVTY